MAVKRPKLGDLDTKISIYQPTESTDTSGGPLKDPYTSFKTAWAQVVYTSPREFIGSETVASAQRAVFRIRNTSGVTTKMQVRFDSRKFKIIGAINIQERNSWMELQCEEVL